MLILIATTNDHKFGEIADIMTPLLPDTVILAPLDRESALVVPDETGTTFQANALQKARFYAKRSGRPCVSDDSGLCVDALNGAPGIHSSRYAPTDKKRIERLLEALEYAGAYLPAERKARFVCHTVLAMPDGRVVSAEGVCEGEIAQEPMGGAGFGYDPVFVVAGVGRTLAELTSGQKNAVSHRGLALASLARSIRTEFSNEL